ncbi:MAG: N-acetyltransferase [Thiomicrospira sp.]|jgi:predicted N-acetyltransferase YhbS|nr:N-acetyltransferase [Thiomicrospira sp.]
MNLQSYQSTDAKPIVDLFHQTFSASEGEQEGALIADLAKQLCQTTRPADLQIYVAIEDLQIIGCIMLTRLTYPQSEKIVFMLAPVAVHPNVQRRGIGQALIEFAKTEMKQQGVDVMVTYGDIGFYAKVGFAPVAEVVLPSPMPLSYPQGWLAQSLKRHEIQPIAGPAECVEAFSNPAYW